MESIQDACLRGFSFDLARESDDPERSMAIFDGSLDQHTASSSEMLHIEVAELARLKLASVDDAVSATEEAGERERRGICFLELERIGLWSRSTEIVSGPIREFCSVRDPALISQMS